MIQMKMILDLITDKISDIIAMVINKIIAKYKIGFKNVELVNDTFDNFLPNHLQKVPQLDFVFFDGNHQKEATINYFNWCVEKAGNKTVFVFDDIHWSGGMTEAWEVIKKHPKVTSTIDLFFVGIVFFNKDLSKEDFTLKF